MVKKKSMENSKEKYILADDSKFSQVSSIKFADFEDAMQFRCAQKAKADYIITRNTKDFTASSIPVYTPHEFLIEILNL